VTTPVYLFQGRRDFVFDLAQAKAAYRLLQGPKQLYIGDFGHSPSSFPGADVEMVVRISQKWFDRYLRGADPIPDLEWTVAVAPDPWRGKTVAFAALPTGKRVTLSSRGRTTIAARGKVVRTFRMPRKAEQFGAPVVRVTASTRTRWPHLVAVLTALKAGGSETVLSDGGAAIQVGRRPRTISFKLVSDANLIPRGARLRLYLGATSTIQSLGNLLYLKPVPDGSLLTIRNVRLTVPVLPKTISG
jgi:hypothetical protein